MIEIMFEGVKLKGLLDSGSQVTLMQQTLFKEHFMQEKLVKVPLGNYICGQIMGWR